MRSEKADASASAFRVPNGTDRVSALSDFAAHLRAAASRTGLLDAVARDLRALYRADRVSILARDRRAPGFGRLVTHDGDGPADITGPFAIEGAWVEPLLAGAEPLCVPDLEKTPAGDDLRRANVGALLAVPVWAGDTVDVVIAIAFAAARAIEEIDVVMLRSIASQVELALESRRLADVDALRGRRADSLERTMLALRELRGTRDILAIVARGLVYDFGRPCVAYEAREGGVFVPVVGSGTRGTREAITLDRFEIELLAAGTIRREGNRDIVGITANDQLRSFLALENGRTALSEDDTKYLRAIATHAGLALSGALAFDQLRRYAAEGAALKEAARTILGFTELQPLAIALSRLALRLVRAHQAAIYAVENEELVLLGSAAGHFEERIPLDATGALAAFELSGDEEPLVAVRLRMTDDDRAGYLVVRRASGEPFERYERRIVEALANLAQLAIRNVDLYERSDLANRALAESNGFKDDLLAMFAHDFKGPLTVISGFSELLLEITEDEEIRSNVNTITDQTKRLGKLADDALALAATQSAGFSLQRQLDDFGSFVYECGGVLDPDGGRLNFEIPGVPIELLFDRVRLRHVVDNVIGNALKYSSGPIDVRVGFDGETAFVEVADHGIGIPEAELAAIFARYGRASNARSRGVSGSGVGLYIAKKIVDVHGGTLTVTSVENQGSTFRVALPL